MRQPVRDRRAALFCHLARLLRQATCRVPWQSLSRPDRAEATAAILLLIEAAETAKAALSQDRSR
jgi:hypothetical protein